MSPLSQFFLEREGKLPLSPEDYAISVIKKQDHEIQKLERVLKIICDRQLNYRVMEIGLN